MGRAFLVVMVLAACGSGDPDVADGDAADGPPSACPEASGCNLLGAPGQQGCDAGDKCSWVVRQVGQLECGAPSCVPDGNRLVGESCTEPEVGGYDDCAAGSICGAGVCLDMCGVDGSAGAACAVGYNCLRESDPSAPPGGRDPIFGVCIPGCDPLTQLNADGTPCPAGDGCYVVARPDDTIAVCATAGTVGVGEVITGGVFANSCVPGAQPRRRSSDSDVYECGGLCRPADVTSTMNQAAEGGVGADSCQARWGAAPPDDPDDGESCRYWWGRESFDGLSPLSNSLGWCVPHAELAYDSDGDNVDDAPFPRCVNLTTGDVVPPIGNPMHNDAHEFWCLRKGAP